MFKQQLFQFLLHTFALPYTCHMYGFFMWIIIPVQVVGSNCQKSSLGALELNHRAKITVILSDNPHIVGDYFFIQPEIAFSVGKKIPNHNKILFFQAAEW